MPSSADTIALAQQLSRLFGWIYTTSWSLSFYPQPILNYRRKSTHGFSPDFAFSNVLGFAALTASTSAFLYSPVIRSEYAARHPRSPEPTARLNDLAFAGHALFWTVVMASQFWPRLWGWPKQSSQAQEETNDGDEPQEALGGKRGSWFCKILCIGGILAVAVMSIIVAVKQRSSKDRNEKAKPYDLAWIDVVYALQYLKLALTMYKYSPQALSNYFRKSTAGWAIGQILFDTVGCILSLGQLAIDSALQDDWSGFFGNPAKLGLAFISLFFDIVFLVQHYILYGDGHKEMEGKADDERTPLINDQTRPDRA